MGWVCEMGPFRARPARVATDAKSAADPIRAGRPLSTCREETVRTRTRLPWARWGFIVCALLFAGWLAWAGRAIWFPVSIALVVAMVLDPFVDRLENRKIPRSWATSLVFCLFLGTVAVSVLILSPAISRQAADISRDLGSLFPDPERPDLVPPTQRILARLDAHPALRDALLTAARAGTERLSSALQGASELVLLWAPNLVWFLVVPVLAFYMLNDFHRIYAKAILLVPPRHRSSAQTLIAEISSLFGKYLRGMGLLCLLLAVATSAMLYAFGSPYWQLLGVMAGVLYAVPVVGPLFTLGLVTLVTLVTGTPAKAAMVGGSLMVLQNGLFDQILTPRILGRQVGLHPILIIIALLLGYQVWGITGMLVAVPLTAAIQAIILHLVPKLGAELELRPLYELQEAEEQTLQEHLKAEERPLDEHFCLHSVVENVDARASEEAAAKLPATETANGGLEVRAA